MCAPRRAACFYAWLPAALLLALAGGAGPASIERGETQVAPMRSTELAQSDVNRMATLAMRDNLDSLLRIADRLYRRNPAEWRKSGAASREAALVELRLSLDSPVPWPELQGRRDIAALSLTLHPDFTGDRVAAFVAASADMLVTAHGGRTRLCLVDSLDNQHVYNAARNVEIAVWLLSNRRNTVDQPLLLTNEISGLERNLSFEREFGKIIGRLDLLAEVVTEKYRCAVISHVQNFVGGTFLQFLPAR